MTRTHLWRGVIAEYRDLLPVTDSTPALASPTPVRRPAAPEAHVHAGSERPVSTESLVNPEQLLPRTPRPLWPSHTKAFQHDRRPGRRG